MTDTTTAVEATTAPATAPTTAPAATPAATAPAAPPTLADGNLLDTAPTQTQTEATTEKLYAGKYKSVEELEKGYLESLKLASGKAPDAYDFAPLESEGLAFDGDEHKATLTGQLKDVGLSQDQLVKLAPIHKAELIRTGTMAAQHVATALGFPADYDPAVERSSLEKAWGDETTAKVEAVKAFAKTLPSSVAGPLSRTAEGMKVLDQLLSMARGPQPIRDGSNPAGQVTLQARLDAIVRDPLYRSSDGRGEALRREASEIAAALNQ